LSKELFFFVFVSVDSRVPRVKKDITTEDTEHGSDLALQIGKSL